MSSVHSLSNLQQELIKLYSADIKEEDLLHIKQYLTTYFANKAMDEADAIWEQRGYSNDTMNQWLNKDNPTYGNESRDSLSGN